MLLVYEQGRDVPSTMLSAHGVEFIYNEFSSKDDSVKEFYEQVFDDIRKTVRNEKCVKLKG